MPLQDAAPLVVGDGQAEQRSPQEPTSPFGWQMPLQLCLPDAQVPPQAAAASMHAPLHSCIPVGQTDAHASPLQVALPPVGTGHAVHDVVPHVALSALLTHFAGVPHRWYPVLHISTQAPA